MTTRTPRPAVVRSTTILSVRRDGQVALGGDGQVTLGNTVAKHDAVKVRRLGGAGGAGGPGAKLPPVLVGFAGSAADAFALMERFEKKLAEHPDNIRKAVIELAKDWRTDRVLRRLEAMLAVADKDASLIITGNGDVLEPEQGLVAIGSGGPYAQSAAKALLENTQLPPAEIVKKALTIAGDLCIYTNQQHVIETID